jgi:hypothetical protein
MSRSLRPHRGWEKIGRNRNHVYGQAVPICDRLQVPGARTLPQFALYASQYAQKPAGLQRHEPAPCLDCDHRQTAKANQTQLVKDI